MSYTVKIWECKDTKQRLRCETLRQRCIDLRQQQSFGVTFRQNFFPDTTAHTAAAFRKTKEGARSLNQKHTSRFSADAMRLPKKLSPHLLLETFVEVHFETLLPSEVAFGAFYKALVDRYTYVPCQAQTVAVPNAHESLQLRTQQESMFLGDETVLRIRDGHVSFNSVDGQYLGWEKYSQVIQWALTQLSETGEIKHFTRAGIRYINGLPWRPFNEQLRVQLLNLPGQPEPERTHIQTSLRTPDDLLVNITVTDQQPVFNQREKQTLFDIDVVWQAAAPTADLAMLFERLEHVHRREKQVFFELLNEDFLATLAPEYE